MPLIVHPSSTCDVCLELYSWSSSSDDNRRPHAISCGHVFCFGCLQRMQPSTCPLCRKAFLPDRVKKLHIDRPPGYSDNDDSTRVSELLQRVALVSGENTEEEQVMGVISEVQQWLATRDDRNHVVYKPLRLAVTALHRYTVTRKESVSIREAIESQNREYLKHLHIKEEDLRMSRTIEGNLVERMQRLEDEYKTKLTRAEKTMAETDSELARLRADHARFRAELARYQDRDIPFRLPGAHRPVMRSPESSTRFMDHDRDRAVRPIESIYHSGRTVRPPARPLTEARNEPGREVTPPLPEPLARRRMFGAPWIIPGASASEKVVPPPPASLSMNSNLGYGNPAPEGFVADRYSERLDRTPRGEAGSTYLRTPNYGFVIGGGYVPLREPSSAAVSQVEERGAVNQLMLYSEANQAPFSADNQPRTVEAAARALAVSSGEIETAETTWGHVRNALRHSIPWNESTSSLATTVATSARTDGVSDSDISNSTSASTSLANLGILAGPIARDAHGPAVTLTQAAAQNGVHHNPSSSEPSLVSTWGTVPSARSSRSSGLGDLDLAGLPSPMDLASATSSHNPSLADLNLMNLPSMRSYESLDAASTAPHHVDPADARTDTPRALTWHMNLSDGMGSPVSQGALGGPDIQQLSEQLGGLGLMFSGSSRSLVTGHQDLDQVNESLRQLLSEERSRASLRRHSRHASMPTLDDHLHSPALSGSNDTRARDEISDSLPFVQPTIYNPMNGILSQHDGNAQTIQQVPVPVPVATAGPARSDRSSNHQRRHSSVAASSQSAAPAPASRWHRDAAAHLHSAQDASGSGRVAQDAPSVTSPGVQAHALRNDPSSPLGIAATQSRDSLMGDGASLLLSFAPPSTSTAATSTGEPTAIHAPRPVDRRQTTNMFGFLRGRGRR